jgi:hypothetical protein
MIICPLRRYIPMEECLSLGLKPLILEDGIVIMPKHDGKNFFVDLGGNSANTEKLKPEQVRAAVKAVRDAGKVVNDILSVHLVSDLPVVITKEMNGTKYDILLNKLVFTPTGNRLSVLAMITTASDAFYAFEGEDVKFTGKGGIESGSLSLLIDNNTEIKDQQLSSKINLKLTGGGFTYGCNGFEDFSLFGNVIFDRTLIVPESTSTGDVVSGNVKSTFKIEHAKDFNDLIINISMQPFQMPSMKGYGFQVSSAVIDLSDKFNTSGFALPKGYNASVDGSLWKGVSIGNIEIRFPKNFKKRKSNDRIQVGVNSLLIDKYGVSGEVYGKNLFTIQEGDLSGWDYSIENASIVVVKNQVVAGSLGGKLRVSISEENKLLGYSAIIDPQKDYYNFSVIVTDSLEFAFLKASKVQLKKASSVTLTLKEGQFSASAMLHGKLNINSGDVKLEEFAFENLFVSTAAPYLKIGSFGGGGSGKEYKMAGFPIALISPVIGVRNNVASIKFGVKVGLDSTKMSATGGFTILGEFASDDGRHFWRHKSFTVNTIDVKGHLGVCEFNGRINLFKSDPIYGDGFGGKLSLSMTEGIKSEMEIAALFGKTTERYWFLDGIMIPGSGAESQGFKVNLLAGTFYSRMKAAPSLGAGNFQSLTGMTYAPDFKVGWGARFAVAMTVGGGKAISGMAGFEISTRADGSLSKIGILGSVAIPSTEISQSQVKAQYSALCNDGDMTNAGSITTRLDQNPNDGNTAAACNKFDKDTDKGPSGFSASIVLKYDYDEESFYGKVGASFTASGGMHIQGVGAFYFAPTKWFVHLGEPPLNSRIIIGLPAFPQIDGYIMMGHGLSELPDPEPNIFVKYPAERSKRRKTNNPETVATGKGIAFGAAIQLGSKGGFPEGKPIVSYDIGVRAGVDIMIIKYPDGTYCLGRSGQPIGLNYWRAGAQLYVIGWARAAAFGINVIDAELGAMLRGSTPNPTFATGQLAINFKMLFVKFKFNVGFKLGDECEPMDGSGSEIEESELIASNYPTDGEVLRQKKITPSVTFLYDVEKPVSIDGFDGKSKITVTDFKLTNTQYNQNIAGNWSIDPSNPKKINFNITEEMPPYRTDMMATLKAKVEVFKNGGWEQLEFDGKKFEQVKNIRFAVGVGLEDIKKEMEANNTTVTTAGTAMVTYANNMATEVKSEVEVAQNKALAKIDSSQEKNDKKYAAADSVLTKIPNLPEPQRKEAKQTLDSAKTQSTAVLAKVTIDVKKIFEVAGNKVDSITTIAVARVETEVADLTSRVGRYVTDGTTKVDELQVQWTRDLQANKENYEFNIKGFENARKEAYKWCQKLNISAPTTDYTVTGMISNILRRYIEAFAPKQYAAIQNGLTPNVNSANYLAYNYCSACVYSDYTATIIKNEMKKKYNDEADRISKESVNNMIAAKIEVNTKSNKDIIAIDLLTTNIVNEARTKCKAIIAEAEKNTNQTIASANAQCEAIMKAAFEKVNTIVNRGRAKADEVDFVALVNKYQSDNAGTFKKEEYETKDGKVAFDGGAIPVSTFTNIVPPSNDPNNNFPVASTILSQGGCKTITQLRDQMCADGTGGNYTKEVFDAKCPAFYSSLTWNDAGLACKYQAPNQYTYDIYVGGFEPSAAVEFSTDGGDSWAAPSFVTKDYKAFVFNKNVSPEEIGKISVLVRASDVETRLRGDFELCTPAPSAKGTLISTSDCNGTTQKRTKTFADGKGGTYTEEITDTTCPVQTVQPDLVENQRSSVTNENKETELQDEIKRLADLQLEEDARQLALFQNRERDRRRAALEKEQEYNQLLKDKQKEIDDEIERVAQQRASIEASQRQQFEREQEESAQRERFVVNQRRRALEIKKQEEDDEQAAAFLRKQQADEQAERTRIEEEQKAKDLREKEAYELAQRLEEEENQRVYAIRERQEVENRIQRAVEIAQQREEQRRNQEEQRRIQMEFQASQRATFEEEIEVPYNGPSKKRNTRIFLPEE